MKLEDLARAPARIAPRSGRRDEELTVLVPPVLLRLALRRAVVRGLRAEGRAVLRSPLFADGSATQKAWLLRLRPPPSEAEAFLSQAFARSLADLPGVVVARTGDSRRLLIDTRRALPAAEVELPDDEHVYLLAADDGHARLKPTDEHVRGEDLLAAPDLQTIDLVEPNAPPPLSGGDVPPPKPEPVSLVRRATSSRIGDAILLDEKDLDRLRRVLSLRPLDERAFLAPGSNRFLLTGPPELLRSVPFGVPLRACKPGGWMIEIGVDLFPPLPPTACRRVFRLDADSVVVVATSGAYRFSLRNLRPAWTLWAGPGPEIREGLSAETSAWLQRCDALAPDAAEARPPGGGAPEDAASDLRRRARQAELLGDYRRAAERLEEAGDLRAAARLWEQAAQRSS